MSSNVLTFQRTVSLSCEDPGKVTVIVNGGPTFHWSPLQGLVQDRENDRFNRDAGLTDQERETIARACMAKMTNTKVK